MSKSQGAASEEWHEAGYTQTWGADLKNAGGFGGEIEADFKTGRLT